MGLFNQIAVFLAYIVGIVFSDFGIRELQWYYYLPILIGSLIILYFVNDLVHGRQLNNLGG